MDLYLEVNSPSLGDTISCTPTLRKLNHCYGRKINIITHVRDVFLNNPYVDTIYSFKEFQNIKLNKKDQVFRTFLGAGQMNEFGVEKKHSIIDIRQFHAIDLGFCLQPNEMQCDFFPDPYVHIDNLPEFFVALHTTYTWPSRTYAPENWQKIIDFLEGTGVFVILLGCDSEENGWHKVKKDTMRLNVSNGLDLTNKTSLSQCWHIIDKAHCFVTMDSGLLHLAGTTDTHIIQLGSSISKDLRAPYRKGYQNYKYSYVNGSCDLFCASDLKYNVKEWGTIQGIPPILNCLEKKETFECHPSYNKAIEVIKDTLEREVFLFIAPHLSTGGSPEYLRWLIKRKKKEGFEVFVLEYCYYGSYEVQRKKIIEEVGEDHFIEFLPLTQPQQRYDEQWEVLKKIVLKVNPNYIHLNELSETFGMRTLPEEFLDFLYGNDNTFNLIETCHTSKDNFATKKRIPDEFYFCSKFHFQLSENIITRKTLVEMPLKEKRNKNKKAAMERLGLSKDEFHVLNVGLFTANKNQKYIYDLAEKLKDYNITFHFVGNTCFFDDCDLSEDQVKLHNCIVHGEKDNVDDFYEATDLFVFPSLEELNPISVKEALSWGMDVFLNKLTSYGDTYDNNDSVSYIDGDNLLDFLKSKSSVRKDSNQFLCNLEKESKIEIIGDSNFDYEIIFRNSITKEIPYKTTIKNNMWSACNFVKNIDIEITNIQTGELKEFKNNKKYTNVINESPSLGDCLAWIPIVEKYAKEKNEHINVFTPFKFLFDLGYYKNLSFFDYQNKTALTENSVIKSIGCFSSDKLNIPLQHLACNLLETNIPEKTLTPKINKSFIKERPIKNKYVCIFTHSTAQLKYWNNKNGWFKTVEYLKSIGYDVICLDKSKHNYAEGFKNSIPKNCIDKTGLSLGDTINWINHADFVVGLSSGLTWLSWACDKPAVLICGFLNKAYHFDTAYFVQNQDVCSNCWTEPNCSFDKTWSWCGKNKDFQCSKEISFNMVKETIDRLIKKEGLR